MFIKIVEHKLHAIKPIEICGEGLRCCVKEFKENLIEN